MINKVLIIGAGVGGLAAGITLRKQGIEVDIVEKNSEWTVYHVGIIVQSNFLRAIKPLGILDKVMAVGYPYRGVEFQDVEGNTVRHVQGPKLAGEDYPSDLGIARPALHKVLSEAGIESGCAVKLGVTYTELNSHDSGVTVTLTDGSVKEYDLVIGADGLYSSVRKTLFGDKYKVEYTGQASWRYNVPRAQGLDTGTLVRGTDTIAGLIPLTPENMYIFIVSDEPGNPWMDNEKLAEMFRERTAEYGGMIADAREQITDSSLVVYRPLEVVFVDEDWNKGRVVLIGDAAHGTTPHYGQGSAQAVEDAVVLAEECGRATSIDSLFNNFMERRFERCKFVGTRSAQAGRDSKTLTSEDQAQRRQEMIDMIAKPI